MILSGFGRSSYRVVWGWSKRVDEIVDEPAPRQKEVASAFRADEARHRVEADRPIRRWHREPAGALLCVAEEWIFFTGEALERRALQPGLLQELELALDIGAETHEEEARVLGLRRHV